MACICTGHFPGKIIPLPIILSDALAVQAGDLRLVVVPPGQKEDLLVMRIIRSNLPNNQVEVGLKTSAFVDTRKELSAWNFCKQSKINMVFTECSERGPFGFKIQKSECKTGTDTVILSKGKFLNKIDDYYHLDPQRFWRVLGGKRVFFTWFIDNGIPPGTEGNIATVSNPITCTNKIGGRIVSVGGITRGTRWKLRAGSVIALIRAGFSFHVTRPAGDTVRVVAAVREDIGSFLKTVADGDEPNNLLNLPQCE